MRIGISYPHPRIRISPAKGKRSSSRSGGENRKRQQERRVSCGRSTTPERNAHYFIRVTAVAKTFLSFPRVQHIRSIPALPISFVFIFLRVTVDPLLLKTSVWLILAFRKERTTFGDARKKSQGKFHRRTTKEMEKRKMAPALSRPFEHSDWGMKKKLKKGSFFL